MKIYYFQLLILKSILFAFVTLQKEDLNFKYTIIGQDYFATMILINIYPTIFWINPEEENITLKRRYKILKNIENDDSSSSFDEELIIDKILNDRESKEKYNEYIEIEDEYNITSFGKQKCNFTPKFSIDNKLNILGLKNLKYLKDNQIIDYETYSFNDTHFSLGKKSLFDNNEQNFFSIYFFDNFSVKLNSIIIQTEEIPIEVDLKIKLDSLDNFYLILNANYIDTFLNILNKFNNNKCKKSSKNSKTFINCEQLVSTNIDINLNNEIFISIPIEKEDNNDITTIIFQNNNQIPYLNILKLAKENRLEFLINTNEKKIEIIGNSTNIKNYSQIKKNQTNSNHKNIAIILIASFSLIIIIILVIIFYKKYCQKEDQNYYYNINKTSIIVD